MPQRFRAQLRSGVRAAAGLFGCGEGGNILWPRTKIGGESRDDGYETESKRGEVPNMRGEEREVEDEEMRDLGRRNVPVTVEGLSIHRQTRLQPGQLLAE